jgi:hypothetical protein
MAAKNPRLNVVLEPMLYYAIKNIAKKEDVSLSLKARDLIKEALTFGEDAYWTKEAEERETTFKKKTALTHKEIWSK